jgi:hypothetical protein
MSTNKPSAFYVVGFTDLAQVVADALEEASPAISGKSSDQRSLHFGSDIGFVGES